MKKLIAAMMALLVLALCVPAGAIKNISILPRPGYLADADFDGVTDDLDPNPKSNEFASSVWHYKPSASIDTSYDYTYKWDYTWFTGDPTEFNYELCRLSSLLGGLGYHQSASDTDASDDLYVVSNALGTNMNLPAFMRAHGMLVEEHNLVDYTDDHHITLVDIGMRNINYKRQNYTIVLVALRGSNGTWAEWNSNFEIGHDKQDCDPDFVPYRFGEHPEWTDPDNHMGFDIAANRVNALVDDFLGRNLTSRTKIVYWVTGHSRGAGIANLCAAKLTDAGKTAFAYTFACPNTTLSADTANYDTIFNVANEDDLVAYLPFNGWGYHRYGRSARLDMNDSMQSRWKSMMGETYDHAESTLSNALTQVEGIASGRNEAYTYTCSCHGDGTDDSIKTDNWYFTESNMYNNGINKTPACLTGYYKLETEHSVLWYTHHCQPPIFFMQLLAAFMAGQMTALEFANYDVADKYETPKWALGLAAVNGVGHPHYCESYFIIADELSASDFTY